MPEYMNFLNSIYSQGKSDLISQVQPGMPGLPFVQARDTGLLDFYNPLLPEVDFSDLPIVWVNGKSGLAYTKWLRDNTGKPWRLPYEIEFEKAARGVDRRYFPMGNHYDPTWILTDDTDVASVPSGKSEYPQDRSIYGLRYMSGNVAEWLLGACLTDFPIDSAGRHIKQYDTITEPTIEMSCRAGASMVNQRYARCTYRQFYTSDSRFPCVSFRITRPIQEGRQ